MIHINQLGYAPNAPKTFVSATQGGAFAVHTATTDEPVYTGLMSGPIHDEASGDTVYIGDFSGVTRTGSYRIQTSRGETSDVFDVSPTVYQALTDALLKAFYFQRCGCALSPAHAGPFAHPPCHLADAVVYAEPHIALAQAGGWHDAGDYGKYTVAAAKAIADLLLAYELFPDSFSHPIDIPESGCGIPDILSEVRYELEWLQKMQRPDGSVFHKVTTRQFPPLDTMPQDDLGELVFSPVSYTAAGTFVAVMAMAARIYEPLDRTFSEHCLRLARTSWHWLIDHGDASGFMNPPGISTGEYGDSTTRDEWYWASAELYRTTGDQEYHDRFTHLAGVGDFSTLALGWADVGGYGTLAYLLMGQDQTDREIYDRLRTSWLVQARILARRSETDGYRVSLLPEEYVWGSLMTLQNHAMHLILADHLTDTHEFGHAAIDHLHYLLGRNPLSQSYVTGFGSKPLLHPHHRPSVGDGVQEPVPGLVSGGPNRHLQDPAAKAALAGQAPARCFIDHEDSYSTNEITIYWNSPAVFVAAYALKSSV